MCVLIGQQVLLDVNMDVTFYIRAYFLRVGILKKQ